MNESSVRQNNSLDALGHASLERGGAEEPGEGGKKRRQESNYFPVPDLNFAIRIYFVEEVD